MLIEKKLAEGDIIAFRLVSGDELIGKLVKSDAQGYHITKPIALQMQMVAPQQAGIGFAPFMVGADEDGPFCFPLEKMLTHPVKAREDIKASYVKATTGIEIPNKGLIT